MQGRIWDEKKLGSNHRLIHPYIHNQTKATPRRHLPTMPGPIPQDQLRFCKEMLGRIGAMVGWLIRDDITLICPVSFSFPFQLRVTLNTFILSGSGTFMNKSGYFGVLILSLIFDLHIRKRPTFTQNVSLHNCLRPTVHRLGSPQEYLNLPNSPFGVLMTRTRNTPPKLNISSLSNTNIK